MNPNLKRKEEIKLKSKKNTFKTVLHYLKKYRVWIVFSILFATLTVICNLYIPILIGQTIDAIVDVNQVDFVTIKEKFLLIIVLTLLIVMGQWLMSVINNKVTFYVIKDVREEAFKKIQILPLKYIDGHPYGDIVSRVIADVDQFADGLLLGFNQLFTGIMTILSTIVFMFMLNPMIAALVVVLTPLSLFVARFIAKKTYHLFKKQATIRGRQTSLIDEMMNHLKIVKAFNYEEEALNRFDIINEELEKCSLNASFFSSLTNPTTRFVNSTIYALICLIGALIALQNPAFTVGKLSSFLSYATQYTKPFNEISGVITELQNAIACANRVFELIDEPPQTSDHESSLCLSNVHGNIDLNHVYFSYEPNQKLIENFNLHVHEGQRIAIVGPTGCGKTTLINLLMRFYDVTKGQILVDHHNIQDITRDSLRKSYGMVLQETWLKEATVMENIRMGKKDATDEEVIEAAKRAHAHPFILQLKNGYQTIIKEDDGVLSQGQKQLLCIARVMIASPSMLILDEATSSIDTRTELKIQQAFNTLMEKKTSFIVAHRLSTIKEADLILVMNNGNIIEQGTHEQLLNQNGFYAKLYHSQFAS